MPRYTSSVSPKGQITIPVDIRKRFGIDPRDRVSFEIRDDDIIVKPVPSVVDALYGSVPPLRDPLTTKELRAIMREEIALNAMREGLDQPEESAS